MEHVTAPVTDDATTPVEVQFLNTLVGGSTIRHRTFPSHEAYVAWLAEVGSIVEIVSATWPFSADERVEIDEALAEGPPWSSIEPDDVERDAELVDEAERRVA